MMNELEAMLGMGPADETAALDAVGITPSAQAPSWDTDELPF